ncbi:vps-50 [Pristionchus pacificus]|uniref:Vesa-1 n=1 Tax=Pristionchus pacificus TaxID=54126 RepID=A0A2A6BPE2_PRIPA|nr:vps-50 [Pristionchus pacificus]|eukprot:PDM67718.1 vesa-1 [Pristionchus pacificus]
MSVTAENHIAEVNARFTNVTERPALALIDYAMEEPTSSKKPSLTRALPRPDTSNEKEVIDSIEASFFVDDDEFDSNDYELKKLAGIDRLCIDDVDRERVRLKSQLLVVSKKISTLILEKGNSYTSQMDEMASIRSELIEVVQRVQTRGLYPLAIRVCTEAQDAANSYSHFDCVKQLSTSLSSCSSSLETALDAALCSSICAFDPDRYLQVYGAYRMLGKVEEAASRLVTLSCAALERRARSCIVAEAAQHATPSTTPTDQMSFEKICEIIPCDRVAESLRELGFALCQILANVHAVIALHSEEDERERLVEGEGHAPSLIARTLSSSLYTIFRTALVRFNTLLCCHDFAQLKFDDVLTTIELATRFRSFGRLHFGHAGVEIDVSLEKQSVLFFARQHAEKMDELRMFVENEAFAVCPLPPNFSLFDLQEFAFLRQSNGTMELSPRQTENGIGEQLDFVMLTHDSVNPFSTEAVASKPKPSKITKKSNGSSSFDTLDGSVDQGSPTKTTSPKLCNAALMVLRLLGRYIRMTSLLHSVADRSIPAITELFEYFLFAMVEFFARDGTEFADPLPVRLSAVLETVDAKIFRSGNSVLTRPLLSSAVQTSQPDRLFALSERLVAIDSIDFVARQLDLTRPVVESLLRPEDEKSVAALGDFYNRVLACVPDVRFAILNAVGSRSLKLPLLVSTIGTTQWNVNELQSKHSTYIDFLVQDLEVFSLRLQHLTLEFPCDEAIRNLLWDRVINAALKAILHGYGQIGARCSNEGRALMQLDVQHLSGRLEKLTGRKATEEIAKIDAYVKAYYLPEKHLEEWALQHTEYTLEQVTSLLAAATHMAGIPAIRSIIRSSDHKCIYFCKCITCKLSGKVPPCAGCDRNDVMLAAAEERAHQFLNEYKVAIQEVDMDRNLELPECFKRCEAKREFLEEIEDRTAYQQTRHAEIFTPYTARAKETFTTHCPECYPWKLHALDIIDEYKVILGERRFKEERRKMRVEMRRRDCTSEARAIQYSRECAICMLETPRTRVAFVKCGHITCVICAEENEELNQKSECPFCRAESGYIKLFETVIEDCTKKEGEPSNTIEMSGGSRSKRKVSANDSDEPVDKKSHSSSRKRIKQLY